MDWASIFHTYFANSFQQRDQINLEDVGQQAPVFDLNSLSAEPPAFSPHTFGDPSSGVNANLSTTQPLSVSILDNGDMSASFTHGLGT